MEYTSTRRMPVDILLSGSYAGDDPFAASLYGEFAQAEGETLRIPGFYKGDGQWAVRFSAADDSEWSYRVISDEITFTSKASGTVQVRGETEGATHALVVKGTRFVNDAGQPVLYLGHECNFLFSMVGSPNGREKLETFVCNLKKGGFNLVQVNSFAVDTSWNKGRTTENDYGPPYIELWDANKQGHKLNASFFDDYDWMVDYLHKNGIYISIYLRVYNKYVDWPAKLSPDEDTYLLHFAARYQAYPNVIWCISKEAYYETDRNYLYRIMSKVRDNDAYHRLCTIQDGLQYALDEQYAHTVDFLVNQQHGEWAHATMYYTLRTQKPVIMGEGGPECGPFGILDSTGFPCWTAEQCVANAYEAVMGGGYYQYYHIYMSWDIIDYDLLPAGYRYFRQMQDFFSQFRMDQMAVVPELCPFGSSAKCMDDGECTLLVYLEPKGTEPYLDYHFDHLLMHPNDSGRRFLSYRRFGIYTNKTTDYTPTLIESGHCCNYFDDENSAHVETMKSSVILRADPKEPVIYIINYEKTPCPGMPNAAKGN